MQFNPAASAYTFTIGPSFRQLDLNGTGIVSSNSGVTQTFNIGPNGRFTFLNAATDAADRRGLF